MPFQLAPFADTGLNEDLLLRLLDAHKARRIPAMRRLWNYYRNAARTHITGDADCSPTIPARDLAQTAGLPARLRGIRRPWDDDRTEAPEIVIENDIMWRIDALNDFAFSRPPRLKSAAPDDARRATIQRIIDAAWDASGGHAFLQDIAMLGSVHGFVDIALRWEDLFAAVRRGGGGAASDPDATAGIARAVEMARRLRVEIIDAGRAIPIPSPHNPRLLRAHIATWPFERTTDTTDHAAARRGVLAALNARLRLAPAATSDIIEVRSASHFHRYEDGELTAELPNPLGILPVVHIQNTSQPFTYEGLSDVEPLIPLQDELNTRLSDRAHRVTLQSFKMYLARGIDGFGNTPVAPGQIWSTDNPDASIDEFGGDASSPSEARHIDEMRDAMDKASGVSPVVLGIIREKLGHLSSENALRITFMGVLSKTTRKRQAYGRAIERMSALMLHALDTAGIFRTARDERTFEIEWEDPLPIDEAERLRTAQLKIALGVPQAQVIAELGF